MEKAKTAQIIIYFRSNENKQPETDEVLRPPERDVQTVRVEQTAPDQGGETEIRQPNSAKQQYTSLQQFLNFESNSDDECEEPADSIQVEWSEISHPAEKKKTFQEIEWDVFQMFQ